jgi:VanZ family protein
MVQAIVDPRQWPLISNRMNRDLMFKWLPALVVMGLIFWFSSQPSKELPDFEWADRLVKKSGHVLGYALLASSYWYALGMKNNRVGLAWSLAMLYALSDEFHQAFVPGRNPSVWDVLLFDNLGSFVGLWLAGQFKKQKRPAAPNR